MFDSVQVDLQGITLLEQAGRDNLINFANSGIGQIDYQAYLTEVSCVHVWFMLNGTDAHRLLPLYLCTKSPSLRLHAHTLSKN